MAIDNETAQVPKQFRAAMRALSRHLPARMGELKRAGRDLRAMTAHGRKK